MSTAVENNFINKRFSNGLIRQLDGVTERDEEHCATYGGILVKTIYFLVLMAGGILLFFMMWNKMEAAVHDSSSTIGIYTFGAIPVALIFMILGPLLAFRIKVLVPVLGTLFCISAGYVVGLFIEFLPKNYSYIGWLAAGLTMSLVLVMAFLYLTKIVKVNQKFKAVITTLFFSFIVFGILSFVGMLIPMIAPYIKAIISNSTFSLVLSVAFLIVACLMLLVDFDTIQNCVEKKLPKKYEWAASFALVYTVINLYLRIFSLLQRAKE